MWTFETDLPASPSTGTPVSSPAPRRTTGRRLVALCVGLGVAVTPAISSAAYGQLRPEGGRTAPAPVTVRLSGAEAAEHFRYPVAVTQTLELVTRNIDGPVLTTDPAHRATHFWPTVSF